MYLEEGCEAEVEGRIKAAWRKWGGRELGWGRVKERYKQRAGNGGGDSVEVGEGKMQNAGRDGGGKWGG